MSDIEKMLEGYRSFNRAVRKAARKLESQGIDPDSFLEEMEEAVYRLFSAADKIRGELVRLKE